jgi:hypothetical protein
MDKQFVSLFAESLTTMLEGAKAAEQGKETVGNAWHGFAHALVQTADLVGGVDSELARFNVEAAYKALTKLAGVDMGKNSTPRVYKKIVLDALSQNVALYEENDDGEATVRELSEVKKDLKGSSSDAARITEQLQRILKTLKRESGVEGNTDEWEQALMMAQSVEVAINDECNFAAKIDSMTRG